MHQFHATKICTPENVEAALRKADAVDGKTITDKELATALVEAHPFANGPFRTQYVGTAAQQIQTLIVLTELAKTDLAQFVRETDQNVTIHFGLLADVNPDSWSVFRL